MTQEEKAIRINEERGRLGIVIPFQCSYYEFDKSNAQVIPGRCILTRKQLDQILQIIKEAQKADPRDKPL